MRDPIYRFCDEMTKDIYPQEKKREKMIRWLLKRIVEPKPNPSSNSDKQKEGNK